MTLSCVDEGGRSVSSKALAKCKQAQHFSTRSLGRVEDIMGIRDDSLSSQTGRL